MRIRLGTLPVFSALVIACGGGGNQDSGREDSPALGSIGSGLVGGVVVPRGDYASVVALQFLGADGRIERFCTAVKVGPRAFLTAGHCLLRGNSPVAFGTSVVLNSATSSASVRVIKLARLSELYRTKFLLPIFDLAGWHRTDRHRRAGGIPADPVHCASKRQRDRGRRRRTGHHHGPRLRGRPIRAHVSGQSAEGRERGRAVSPMQRGSTPATF